MGRRAKSSRDMSMEAFDQWCAATDAVKATLEATAEEGGPRVSLVPDPVSVPLDVLPDEVEVPVTLVPGELRAVPFDPEPSRKTGGWSAYRQRDFIEVLAETGSIHVAARGAARVFRRAVPTRCGFARRPSPRRGTGRRCSPSGGCPRSPSTAPSTAASNKSIIRAT